MSVPLPLLYPPGARAQEPVPPPTTETWWDVFNAQRDTDMPPQLRSWTCSICATDWVLRATGLNPWSAREQVAGQIGYPHCVNENVGLVDTTCLLPVFEQYGVDAMQEWVDWDRCFDICSETTGVLNGLGWYHFVAIRGLTDWGGLWIANSAESYRGVYSTLSEEQFNALGPFQVVRLAR